MAFITHTGTHTYSSLCPAVRRSTNARGNAAAGQRATKQQQLLRNKMQKQSTAVLNSLDTQYICENAGTASPATLNEWYRTLGWVWLGWARLQLAKALGQWHRA